MEYQNTVNKQLFEINNITVSTILKSIVLILIIVITYNLHKAIFFTSIFCILILTKSFISRYFKIQSLPISLNDIGIIYCNYVFSPVYGLIIILFSLLCKFIFSNFRNEHIATSIYITLVGLLIPFFRSMHLLVLSIFFLIARYSLEYVTKIVLGNFDFKNVPKRLLRTTITLIFIYYTYTGFLSLLV